MDGTEADFLVTPGIVPIWLLCQKMGSTDIKTESSGRVTGRWAASYIQMCNLEFNLSRNVDFEIHLVQPVLRVIETAVYYFYGKGFNPGSMDKDTRTRISSSSTVKGYTPRCMDENCALVSTIVTTVQSLWEVKFEQQFRSAFQEMTAEWQRQMFHEEMRQHRKATKGIY